MKCLYDPRKLVTHGNWWHGSTCGMVSVSGDLQAKKEYGQTMGVMHNTDCFCFCWAQMSLNDTKPKTISAQSGLLAVDSITSCLTIHCHSKDIQCHVLPLFSMLANHQIRHRATTKLVSQPCNCWWQPFIRICVDIYGLKYSIFSTTKVCWRCLMYVQ